MIYRRPCVLVQWFLLFGLYYFPINVEMFLFQALDGHGKVSVSMALLRGIRKKEYLLTKID